MRSLMVLAIGTLGLCACSSGGNNNADANKDMNALTDQNMMIDQNAMGDQNAMMDANGMTDVNAMTNAGGADANTATNSAEENGLKKKDLQTNDKDTNLQNGL